MRFYLSAEEKADLFFIELVRAGVNIEKAKIVAKILSSNRTDEDLTKEEIELTQEVCKEWVKHRNRWNLITNVLDQLTH